MNQIKYIIVHHTAVSWSKNPKQWQQTNEYHKKEFNMLSSLGFYGGYNYEIAADGSVFQFRNDGEETAAVVGHNKDSIQISLDGNFDIELPTKEQIDTLQVLLAHKKDQYKIPLENIVPHRKFAQKTCYGKKLSDTWASDLIKVAPVQPAYKESLKIAVSLLEKSVAILKDEINK